MGSVPPKRKVPRRKKSCMFCTSEEHFTSRCPVHFSAEARIKVMKDKGSNPCDHCIITHDANKACLPCSNKDCKNITSHGTLACLLILNQLHQQHHPVATDTRVVEVVTKKICSI